MEGDLSCSCLLLPPHSPPPLPACLALSPAFCLPAPFPPPLPAPSTCSVLHIPALMPFTSLKSAGRYWALKLVSLGKNVTLDYCALRLAWLGIACMRTALHGAFADADGMLCMRAKHFQSRPSFAAKPWRYVLLLCIVCL